MTNQQAPEIYTLHTVPNKGERPWSGIYGVRADAEHDAKVMRDVTGRHWSVVRLVVADTAATPTGPVARYEVVDCIDSKHVPAVIPKPHGPWVRYEDHIAALAAGQATAAPAQPAAPQDAAYAALPEKYYLAGGEVPTWDAKQMHAFADATHALRTTPVQNPAEIEHVAGDVSKNGAEVNMAQQPSPSVASKAVLAAIRAANMQLVRTGDDEFMLVTYKNAKAQCDGGKCGIGGYCDDCPAPQPAPATQQVGEVPSGYVIDLIGKLVQAESNKTRTHQEYRGKAMPYDVYARFQRLRDETIPALRTQLLDALAAAPQPSPTPQADSQPAHQWDTGYPPLPRPDLYDAAAGAVGWSESALQGFVDADRAARAPADSQPAATGRIAELEDALSSCLQLVNQLNEHHIPDGCSRLIRHIKDAAATVSKAQASAPADSVTAPAGWKLVPVEPSLDQEWQGKEASSRVSTMAEACKIYKAMLAAAPTPPAQAADSVLEDAARLDWLALAGPTSICLVIDRPHDGEIEVATDDVTGYGQTLREALDAARKGGAT